MFTFLVTIHLIICLTLIFLVLLQSGRGAELGAAFGSVGQANMGRTPMTGIAKVTAVFAALFMISSLGLAYLSSEKAKESVVESLPAVSAPAETPVSTESAPATPASADAEPATPAPASAE